MSYSSNSSSSRWVSLFTGLQYIVTYVVYSHDMNLKYMSDNIGQSSIGNKSQICNISI